MSMVVCVAGMHRSATSMITRMLSICGLYLGEEKELYPAQPDNPEGFWEHFEFHSINERILSAFHGAWDAPPKLPEGWERDPRLDPLREEAIRLIGHFKDHEHWGWKDPRNSITLAFWRDLIPNLKTLVPIRHPLDVALSLSKRGYSSDNFGLQLWQAYSAAVAENFDPKAMMFTHQTVYFENPAPELDRILGFCGLTASAEQKDKALSTISKGLRHSNSQLSDLFRSSVPTEIIAQYLEDCSRCGPNFHETFLTQLAAVSQLEAQRDAQIADLKRKLNIEHLSSAHKDEEVRRLQELIRTADERKAADLQQMQTAYEECLSDTRKSYEAQLFDAANKLESVQHELEAVKASRAWKIGSALTRAASAPKRILKK